MVKSLTTEEWVVLIGKERLQNFQDSMARSYNINLCFQNLNGKPITVWSNMSLLCYTLESKNREKCENEHLKILHTLKEKKEKDYLIVQCYVGMTNFFFPVYFNNILIAVLRGGGIVTDNTSLSQEILTKYHVPELKEKEIKKICELICNSLKLINIDLKLLESLEHKTVLVEETMVSFDNKLSKRETEVANLICAGLTNRQIAENLFISEKTVKSHVSNILVKLDLRDRIHLVVEYGNNG